MLNLPVELRRRCIDFLDRVTLKAVRQVNKELSTLATEALFRTAVLRHTDESVERFNALVESPLSPLIRRVAIHTSEDPQNDDSEQSELPIEESFTEAFELLSQIENLQEVELNFGRDCANEDDMWARDAPETVHFRTEILKPFFATLAKAEKVKSLSIANLQDYMPEVIFESEDFKTVRSRLTKLALQIATEYDDASPENSISKPMCHQGFMRSLPDIWLKPMANQLTHLTIYGGECMWGIWPFTDFRELPPFPRLKSLSLGNLSIAHDWQIDWILAHAPTLEELLLDECPIIIALKMDRDMAKLNFPDLEQFPGQGTTRFRIGGPIYWRDNEMRWHHILDRFRTGLPRLQRFVMGNGNWSDGLAFHERYVLENKIDYCSYHVFDCGIGPSQWISMSNDYGKKAHTFRRVGEQKVMEPPECLEEDQTALDALFDAMRHRAGGA